MCVRTELERFCLVPTDVTEPQRPSMTPGNWELVEMCLTLIAGSHVIRRHVASQNPRKQVDDVSVAVFSILSLSWNPLLPSYLLHLTRARPPERRVRAGRVFPQQQEPRNHTLSRRSAPVEKGEESVFHTCHLMSPHLRVERWCWWGWWRWRWRWRGLLVQVWAVNRLHEPDRSRQRNIIIGGFLRDQEGLPLRHHFQGLCVINVFL